MRKTLVCLLVIWITGAWLFAGAAYAQDEPPISGPPPGAYPAPPPGPVPPPPPDASAYQAYSAEQLDNLLAPIALYPDPLLAQVLPAATFVDQIDEAARWVRVNGEDGIDDQDWDVSVKAVAHYQSVLYMLDGNLDWTTALGQAYVSQSSDVMASIQRLRSMAYAQGNLVSTPQWQIADQDSDIQIWPADPQYMYVPTYDPDVIFYQPVYSEGSYGDALVFGVGLAIGVWLDRDFDWQHHRIFYHGWQGGGWIGRSRPYIHASNVYVNNSYTHISVNHTVVNRPINAANISNYNSVHRATPYRYQPNTAVSTRNDVVNNGVINRNINTSDPRLDQFRGRQTPVQPAPVQFAQPAAPRYQPTPQARPVAQPEPQAFGRNQGNFAPREASQRGQDSRAQIHAAPHSAAPHSKGRPPKSSGEQH